MYAPLTQSAGPKLPPKIYIGITEAMDGNATYHVLEKSQCSKLSW